MVLLGLPKHGCFGCFAHRWAADEWCRLYGGRRSFTVPAPLHQESGSVYTGQYNYFKQLCNVLNWVNVYIIILPLLLFCWCSILPCLVNQSVLAPSQLPTPPLLLCTFFHSVYLISTLPPRTHYGVAWGYRREDWLTIWRQKPTSPRTQTVTLVRIA